MGLSVWTGFVQIYSWDLRSGKSRMQKMHVQSSDEGPLDLAVGGTIINIGDHLADLLPFLTLQSILNVRHLHRTYASPRYTEETTCIDRKARVSVILGNLFLSYKQSWVAWESSRFRQVHHGLDHLSCTNEML